MAVPWMKNKADDADWQVTPYPVSTSKESSTKSTKSSELKQSSNNQSLTLTKLSPGTNQAERAVANSLCQVNYNMPYFIDGAPGAHFFGTGLVVDAEKGLIIVDRNTVPTSLGDVRISFGTSLDVQTCVTNIYLYILPCSLHLFFF